MQLKHPAFLLLPTAALVLILSACSSSQDLPAAFGQDGKCYYVKHESEAKKLKQDKKCSSNATDAQAPNSWLITYYAFYNSSFYRDTYVASADRASYKSDLESFYSTNKSAIAAAVSSAKYVNSDGEEESGTQAGISSTGEEEPVHEGGISGSSGEEGGSHGGTIEEPHVSVGGER